MRFSNLLLRADMKRLIIFAVIALLAVDAFSQGLSDAWTSTKETVTNTFTKEEKACPVYAATPMAQIKRKPWEVEAGFNLLMFPSNGGPQIKTNSWGIEVVHNMSSVFAVYVRYDLINYEKYNYENSEYDKEWENYVVSGGAHLYLNPVVRVFGGFGKVYAADKDGNEPDLGTSVEYGVKYDIPLQGYKLVLFFKTVEARLTDDNPDIEESTGTQSYSVAGASLSIPFGY